MTDSYTSLGRFYAARRARQRSRKIDYGVRWYTRPAVGGIRPPPWRVTYIRDTGEVFATPTAGRGPVHILAVVPVPMYPFPWTQTLDRLLTGWADEELTGRQLSWVRNRLRPVAGSGATRT